MSTPLHAVLGLRARYARLGLVVMALSSAMAPALAQETRMWMTVGDKRYAVSLDDTPTTRALVSQLPLAVQMEELNGNEKKVKLPRALPTATFRPGTIRTGDLLLWGSDTLVVFYKTFDSPYSYTKLGRVVDPVGLPGTLGPGDPKVTFSRD